MILILSSRLTLIMWVEICRLGKVKKRNIEGGRIPVRPGVPTSDSRDAMFWVFLAFVLREVTFGVSAFNKGTLALHERTNNEAK